MRIFCCIGTVSRGKYHGIFCDSSVRHKEINEVPKCIIQRCLYNKYIFQITSYKQTTNKQNPQANPQTKQTKNPEEITASSINHLLEIVQKSLS